MIHLDDLSDEVIPTLSTGARELLKPYWERLVEEFGYDRSMGHFRCLRDLVKTAKVTRWSSLRTWRRLAGLNIRDLEPFVTAIRASSTGKTRIILNPRLPFNLATPWGAKMIGYRGDAAHTTSAFHNLEKELHEDYRRAITETVGEVPFTTTVRSADEYIRTNVGTFVTILTSIGWPRQLSKTESRQEPAPRAWFFSCDEQTRIGGLRALWDAEGSPGYDYIRLSQVTSPPNLTSQLPKWPMKVRFNALEDTGREVILAHPPLLLVSASLLLFQPGILSYLSPELASRTKHSVSAYWNLTIHRTRNMRLFEERIGFLSPSKSKRLVEFNRLHKPRDSSSVSTLAVHRIQ